MTRKLTQLGVAPPKQVNERPSGRYRVQYPEAPTGSILRATTPDGGQVFIEIVEVNDRRLFVDVEGEPISVKDWDFATRAEAEAFKLERFVGYMTDQADLRGAPAFVSWVIGEFPSMRFVPLFDAVAEELRRRNKPGKATQLLAYLIIGEE